ncbi:coniferyl aldehyde dehydrogenase [Agrilutibacter solisilvae]|uniref:Aldehyde dehydrogenase n=1 Tax=Agrilutibacter solisilvae TaxID=2763317 RepID=A0A974XZM9_9GAMM|nr:coniferyl aldehyde dehydrogenase [Lysobacter solisilvae]QSX77760.1 coniferyl aldehyde dehydrogenase [Lysobacter solisilvae]
MDIAADTPTNELAPTLESLRRAWLRKRPDFAQRRDDLKRLRAAFHGRLEEMARAVSDDFGHRSSHETLLADGMTVLVEIDHMLANLRSWMRPRRRGVGWRLWPASARVHHVPVGVVGVISPWNYPVNLALVPLATAIAAGNHVYLKPSEHTPRTSRFLRELLSEVFPADRVAVALGGPEVASAFSALPFDHLFFTGSTPVGRKVMAAAAPNLTPVTLELGGKSPAIVGEDASMDVVAARIATGKLLNAGQTCIAPDYVLVPHARRDAFVQALRREVQSRYTDIQATPDYTRIVNQGQYERLRGYLDDAVARGYEVVPLLPLGDAAQAQDDRLLPPTLVIEPGDDALVMQEEIFGPILPVKTYRSFDEAIDYINAHDRPLALYHFGHDRARVDQLLERTVSGGVCINDTLLHYACSNLPFGGIGASGMGQYHGYEGFLTFTKAMPVLRQVRWTVTDRLRPPYTGLPARIIQFLLR